MWLVDGIVTGVDRRCYGHAQLAGNIMNKRSMDGNLHRMNTLVNGGLA